MVSVFIIFNINKACMCILNILDCILEAQCLLFVLIT